MNIVMITNTYVPHVGGVAGSVVRFSAEYRRHGHKVLIVAPTYPDQPAAEEDVVRMPALPNFNGSEFSMALPTPLYLTETLNNFEPDIIHSHHPYLLGDTALRTASIRQVPVVFTHHTMYEAYTHYVPVEAINFPRFIVELATGYANACDQVIAPSESVKRILAERGVITPIDVIPTGVDITEFSGGDGTAFRRTYNIPEDAFVVGHLGRLALEKNLDYMSSSVSIFLKQAPNARFLVVGGGQAEDEMRATLQTAGALQQVVFAGTLTGADVVDAYHAMDLFVFASKSDTQGMVLVEAMAAGLPVVALDASGARDIVRDKETGRLLPEDAPPEDFAAALAELSADHAGREAMRAAAREHAKDFTTQQCAGKALALYERVLHRARHSSKFVDSDWAALLQRVAQEWTLWSNRVSAFSASLPWNNNDDF